MTHATPAGSATSTESSSAEPATGLPAGGPDALAAFAPVRDLWLQHAPWDRRGEERLRDGLLPEVLADPATLVCETTDRRVRLSPSGRGLAWRPVTEHDADGALPVWLGGSPARLVRIVPDGDIAQQGVAPEEAAEMAGAAGSSGDWTPWRDAVAHLDVDDAEAMAVGLSLGRWHALHPFCARCGAATRIAAAGWLRRCDACGAEHYPRTDPVVIMAVLDADDRICLARGHQWTSAVGMSCVAGFVDSAESLEDAVRREVFEELGLRVTEVAYAGSQPWPAAGQLMVAMVARVADPELRIDPAEVAAASWFTRDELRAALVAGELTLPASFAAGRWLVESWLGERIDERHATVYSRVPTV